MEEESLSIPRRRIKIDPILGPTIIILSFLLPFFTLPGYGLAEVNKKAFFSVTILILFAIWLLDRLIDGKFTFPRSSLLFISLLILLASLLSTIFSPVFGISFSGFGFETDTFVSWAIYFVLLFIVSIVFQKIRYIKGFLFALLSSFTLVAVVQIVNFVFSIFPIQTKNLVGSWADLSMFSAFVLIISTLVFDSLKTRKIKFLVLVPFILSLFLFSINSTTVLWTVVLFLSFAVLLHKFFRFRVEERKLKKTLKSLASVIFLVSLIFIIWGRSSGPIHSIVDKYFPRPIEIRPTLSETFKVARDSSKENLFLGTGPNRFNYSWQKFKSVEVNEGPFWNIEFGSGYNLILTILVTGGLFSLVPWLLFIFATVFLGLKLISNSEENHDENLIIYFGTVFLLTLMLIQSPSSTMTFFTFVFVGVLISLLVNQRISKNYIITTSREPVVGFVAVLTVVVLLIGSISIGYLVVGKWRAISIYNSGSTGLISGDDIDLVIKKIEKAISIDEKDLYYRRLTQGLLAKLDLVAEKVDAGALDLESEFINTYRGATSAAKASVEVDRTNYLNWLSLSSVYEVIVPFGNDAAYDLAKETYAEALDRSPNNPTIYNRLAKTEIAFGNNAEARVALEKSVELKKDYVDSLLLLAQMDIAQNDVELAIGKVERAVLADPTNIGLLFELGYLKYRTGNWNGAVEALLAATSLNPDYANALYFLGLSYYNLGQQEEAILIFERIESLNPDHLGIKNVLSDLRSNRDPAQSVKSLESSPIDEN